MARTRYCVVLHRRKWVILLNGSHYGPYPSQQTAIHAAVQAAGENGRDSDVVVQDEDEDSRIVWTYGDDALKLSA
jgi:hypothetical protein